MMNTRSPSESVALPRWRQIYDQLLLDLPNFQYGRNFYTIAEICQKFEVSTITASRVLGQMESEGLVQKIRRRGTVVRRVDQDVTAWMLMPAQRPLDWPDFDSRWTRLITAMSHSAKRRGIQFAFVPETRLASLLAATGQRFGILLLSSLQPESVRQVEESGRPYVLVDHWKDRHRGPWARLDRLAVSELAVQHLASLGHRRIAFMSGSLSERGWRHRLKGYRSALERAGLKFRWELVADASATYSFDTARQSAAFAMQQCQAQFKTQVAFAFDKLLAARKPPTAIIAGDDVRAIMLLELCRDRGMKVPGELSIIGFPNNPESGLASPGLTVVDGCYEQVGDAAVQAIMAQLLEGQKPQDQRLVVRPQLVIRNSTGGPNGGKASDKATTDVIEPAPQPEQAAEPGTVNPVEP
jgi:DNA-binding LacI/PurR family transcriptional regulator